MVNLKRMIEEIYPYREENRIRIEDEFMRAYYIFTISNRPMAFYMEERFPVLVENDTLVISKRENIRFCAKFEQIIREDMSILERILNDRDEYIRKINEAKEMGKIEEILKNLFLLGRYGIEWYFPYMLLYERLKKYFTDEKIDKITSTIKISDELSYYLKIWEGLEKLKRKEMSVTKFIENYGFYGRKSLEECEYEDPQYVLKLLTYENPIITLLAQKRQNLEEKRKKMKWLHSRVDQETFILLNCFANIDTENEIIHNERAKVLKFLSDRGITIKEAIEILKQQGMV